MKSLWKKFIAWITFGKTNNHHKTDLRSGIDKHYRLDTSYTQEQEIDDDHVKLYDQAKSMARIEGITLNQAISKIADKYSGMRTIDIAEDGPEKVVSINSDKMHGFIAQKKNRKPFYKDDNKKTWE